MPAGTIALTNNSTAVTGSGTNFSSELKANDFLVAIVGGVTYTLGVQSVNSATSVTLTTAYNGPTTSGLAWTAVPNAALVGITAQVAADVSKAIRGLNLDKANWQQVYSASGNITVTLPDGSQYSGPSWASLTNSLAAKADKNDARITGALQRDGGLLTGKVESVFKGSAGLIKGGGGWVSETGSVSGNNIVTQVYDSTGGSTSFDDLYLAGGQYWAYRKVLIAGGAATRVWEWRNDGSFRSPGTIYSSGTALTSDKRLKSNFEDVEYSIDIIDNIVPKYYDKAMPDDPSQVTRELGVVAQDIKKVLPDLVSSYYWSEEFPDLLSVNYSGLSAWLVGYCAFLKDQIKSNTKVINAYEARLNELEARMKAIDGLDG